MGRWAEDTVARRLGVRAWPDTRTLRVPHLRDAVQADVVYELIPDLWWALGRGAVEVKCGLRRYYVTRRQLDGYEYVVRSDTGPVPGIRVYYAFLSYQTAQRMRGCGVSALRAQFDATLPPVIPLLDVALVRRLADICGYWGRDAVTPLSGLLGAWEDYARITPRRLTSFLSALTPRCTGPDWALYTEAPDPDPWVGPLPCEPIALFPPLDPIW